MVDRDYMRHFQTKKSSIALSEDTTKVHSSRYIAIRASNHLGPSTYPTLETGPGGCPGDARTDQERLHYS